MIKPRDSRVDLVKEICLEDMEEDYETNRISSSKEKLLSPLNLMKDKGTLSILEKMRGAQVSPKTKAIKQYLTPSKSKQRYL